MKQQRPPFGWWLMQTISILCIPAALFALAMAFYTAIGGTL